MFVGCNRQNSVESTEIKVDGSSTVYPIAERMAEKYNEKFPQERPTIGTSGTGGGFKKFTAGEIDIVTASRPIEENEIELANKNSIQFIELPIAIDGLTVVVNKENTFIDEITVSELRKIWESDSMVKNWIDINPKYPNSPINLYGPGTDSGTFDYFTKVINGKEKSSRGDYQASEDDNTLVQGINGDKFSMGYFGYAYYEENKSTLKALRVYNDSLKKYVSPNPETIKSGDYSPLSRPLFIYVNKESLNKPSVKKFINYILTDGTLHIRSAGYVPFDHNVYSEAIYRITNNVTGSQVHGIEKGSLKAISDYKK